MKVAAIVLSGSFILLAVVSRGVCLEEEEDPYTSLDPSKREPSPCEICKFFVEEFSQRLSETGKSREIIRTGHGLDSRKKEIKYQTAELRLIEALQDPHVCDKILEYNVHAERDGSNRYAKGMSETFQTLHGLVNKGVQVELGIPHDLWDKPSAEVTKMHRACFNLAERYEDDIEDWYYHKQHIPLMKYLCEDRYLEHKKWDKSCLLETWTGKEVRKEFQQKGEGEEVEEKTEKKKTKAKRKSRKGDDEAAREEL